LATIQNFILLIDHSSSIAIEFLKPKAACYFKTKLLITLLNPR
jgi:hypothetical protein